MTDSNCSTTLQADRYVALIDILGFRSLLATVPLATVVERVDSLLVDAQRRLTAVSHSADGHKHVRSLGTAHFSDTILMWTPPVTNREAGERAGGHLFFAVTELLYRSFVGGLPLRAGIGFGESYIDTTRHMFVGPAIVDAYEVELSQDWAGGALHPSVPYGVPYIGSLMEYEVPTKVGASVTPRLALKWPDCPDTPAEHKLLKRKAETTFVADEPEAVRRKLENTRRFVTAIQSKIRFSTITATGATEWFNPSED